MAVRKITISIPPEMADEIRADARSAGTSVSGWIVEAAAAELRRKHMKAALGEFERRRGPLTDQEKAEADTIWPD